jgi:ABC-type transport system involved in multi-copper enzyme maturation permease subunit
MTPTLRSEFKKLFTVRSTYVLSLIFLLLMGFLAFYVDGFKNVPTETLSPLDHAKASLFVAGTITQIANTISVAGALIALLLLAHEYRYNTIVYTLTASNSRSKVLASKIFAILAYVLVFAAVASIIGLGLVYAGVAASGHSIPHQDINYLTYVAKAVFLSEAYAMAGLLFITLIRNQVGAIAALLIIPNTVEGLLSLLLKQNSVYMPFTALQQVVQPPVVNGVIAGHSRVHDSATGYLSAPRGVLVFLAYLAVGWIVAWYLFLRRDATT